MKPSSFILLISIYSVFSCHAAVKTNGTIHLTDSNYAVIPYTISEFARFKNAKPATLTKQEIQEIETLTNKSIAEYNKKSKWEKIDKNYKAQLVPVINEKGEKEVWVNCFCSTRFNNWRTGIVEVEDGGSCFFNLKINLTTGKYYDLEVNGSA